MASLIVEPRKRPRAPAGFEAHLTRRQAAALLGFASEFKVREFERQGLLRAVRGPMRTAFYARPELLALRAKLGLVEPGNAAPESWSDADLLALLGHPKAGGQARTALDLVTETRISIERAERVYAFFANGGTRLSSFAPAPSASADSADPPPAEPAAEPERRGEARLARDTLIHQLRDPDPQTRQQAFERLRARRG